MFVFSPPVTFLFNISLTKDYFSFMWLHLLIKVLRRETNLKYQTIVLFYNIFSNDFFSINQQTNVVNTDFEKIFDRVDLSLFILKLKKICFTNPLLFWLDLFLSLNYNL